MSAHKERQAALLILNEWRQQGVPLTITPHDAWVLTGGVVGTQHLKSKSVPLAAVALTAAHADPDVTQWASIAKMVQEDGYEY